ncbi:hypothetical protein MAPG_09748 [Magnaporthiopsis poae ATCC 64411]|uniref:Methyltransferase type 11 domain-containing protein n=1 Tax=Magnaporthiopsis poae (strain ATCC 64411 / 73-15) TaxID=644358 RepID=A0A0C4EAR9_MAGP6|nr:hypothetical protein MAPG_09748 [Magnaporthiopsis poae ATCC 64411]
MSSTYTRMAETYEAIFPAMRLFAADAVSLAPPITEKSVVHDNGCGPGIVTAEILSRHQRRPSLDHQHQKPLLQQTWQRPRRRSQQQAHHQTGHPRDAPRIEATDISPVMVSAAARRGAAVRSQVMDSRELFGFDDAVFTHSFSNFVVLGMSEADTARVVSEMRRTLKPGGVAVLTAWRALGYLDVFEQVAARQMAASSSEASLQSNMGSNHDRSPPSQQRHRSVDTREAVLTERQLRLALELGGFPVSGKASAPVELRSVTRALPWAIWTNEAYAPIRRSMCDGYTRGWSRVDTDRLDAAFAERVARLAEEGASYRVTAWIAVMKKA